MKEKADFKKFSRDLPSGLFLITFGRFISNVAYRLVFPFLPTISRGLGVTTGTLGTALAMRDLVEMSSPLLGKAIDKRGTNQAMVVGALGLGMAAALQGASSGLILFVFALVLTAISKNSFDIGSSAWAGASVPYAHRSRAIGMIETTWALSFVIGMPIASVLIRAGTWRTPFIVISILCVIVGIIFNQRLPTNPPISSLENRSRLSLTAKKVICAMIALGAGHMMMLVTFATFLEDEHNVSTSGLGFVAVIIGLAELVGSGGVALIGDKIGKVVVVKYALTLSLPLSILLPLGSSSLWLALLLISLWFICTESVIVSMLSTCTELDKSARGAMMGFVYAGWALGRLFGAIFGSRVYESSGIVPVASVMTAVLTIALLVVYQAFKDQIATAKVSE